MSLSQPPRADLRARAMRAWLGAQLAVGRHGLLWPAALVLAMAAAVVQLGIVGPARARQAEARLAMRALAAQASVRPLAAPDATEATSLDAFEAVLRPENELDDEVRELYGIAAASGLPIRGAQFSAATDPESGVRRLAVGLTVSGRYVGVRDFIDAALLRLPNLSFDEISLSDPKVPGAALDVRIRLSLWGRPQEGLRSAQPAMHSTMRGA